MSSLEWPSRAFYWVVLIVAIAIATRDRQEHFHGMVSNAVANADSSVSTFNLHNANVMIMTQMYTPQRFR